MRSRRNECNVSVVGTKYFESWMIGESLCQIWRQRGGEHREHRIWHPPILREPRRICLCICLCICHNSMKTLPHRTIFSCCEVPGKLSAASAAPGETRRRRSQKLRSLTILLTRHHNLLMNKKPSVWLPILSVPCQFIVCSQKRFVFLIFVLVSRRSKLLILLRASSPPSSLLSSPSLLLSSLLNRQSCLVACLTVSC